MTVYSPVYDDVATYQHFLTQLTLNTLLTVNLGAKVAAEATLQNKMPSFLNFSSVNKYKIKTIKQNYSKPCGFCKIKYC